MYSNSQLDVATDFCFLLNYDIGPPYSIVTLPETLFRLVLSLA
jgi:hypothetical protein